ncbi:MAG: pirin family protein [Pseudomonadota bacterium]|nr:pirin family protein [Pseudomonadota bacterium]
MVGPFIFFDQMGPAEFLTGQGIDVRPHPHIGLATVTYLYRGEFQHRDSLGSNQMILPGAVNWMVAGRGVTHSERTSAATRLAPHDVFGIQTWVALPKSAEETAPSFAHHGREALPVLEAEGARLRVILGNAYGARAPAQVFTETFYVDAALDPGARLALPDDHEDRGLYVVEGEITVAGDVFAAGRMLVFRPGDRIALGAGPTGARLLLLGGATMDGPRYIWWNFVASSQEKIEAAKQAWRREDRLRFELPPDDRAEFVPAP